MMRFELGLEQPDPKRALVALHRLYDRFERMREQRQGGRLGGVRRTLQ
jgi:hypothetical protein